MSIINFDDFKTAGKVNFNASATTDYSTNEAFKTHNVVIVDAAAIIESGYADTCDKLIVVTAPEEIRKERIIKRDNISEKDALIRIKGQKTDEFYESKADYIIKNYEPFLLENELAELIKNIF